MTRVESLPGWRPPLEVLPIFGDDPMVALLLSASAGRDDPEISRWSILVAAPFEVIAWSESDGGDPLRRLVDAASRFACEPVPGLPFAGGAVGYVGYDVGRCIERIRSRGTPGLGLPDMQFGLYSWAILWDHLESRWSLVATGLPEIGAARAEKALRDLRWIRERLASGGREARSIAGGRASRCGRLDRILSSSLTREGHIEMVRAAKDLIAEGQVYQVNLSQRLELPAPSSATRLCAEIAARSPAPFVAYLEGGPFRILSASPERFLRMRGDLAESRPIKGTRPRGSTPDEDLALARELAGSPKDRAENVMIVDLVRHDLGRVCATGSVEVAEMCRIESYASVHHLTSIVRGRIDPRHDAADLLQALFPGGSMTGAPKIRAMQAIEDLEPVRRGIYAGALGYLSFCGSIDLSMVIRTAIVAGGRTWLQVGGGIVADSDPESEYQECLDKARSVLDALEAAG